MEQDQVSPIKPELVGFVCLFPLHWRIYRVRFLNEQCHMSWGEKQRCVNGLGRFFCIDLSGCCRILVLKGEDVKLLDRRRWWRKTACMSVSFCVCTFVFLRFVILNLLGIFFYYLGLFYTTIHALGKTFLSFSESLCMQYQIHSRFQPMNRPQMTCHRTEYWPTDPFISVCLDTDGNIYFWMLCFTWYHVPISEVDITV